MPANEIIVDSDETVFDDGEDKSEASTYPLDSDLGYYSEVIKANPCFNREEEKIVYAELLEIRARFFEMEEAFKRNPENLDLMREFRIVKAEFARHCNYIVRHNLKMVISVVNKIRNRKGVGLIDLVQAGAMGLNKALVKYDPEKGRLSTYGSWWIKHYARRYIADKARTVRVPIYLQALIPDFIRVNAELELQGRGTDEEIAQIMEVPVSTIVNLRKALHTAHMFSLDVPMSGDNGGTSFKDLIEDEDTDSPEVAYHLRQVSVLVHGLIDGLDSEIQKHVVKERIGGRTLKEIGDKMHLSRERIRQIEAEAKENMFLAARQRGFSVDDL